MPAHNKPKQTLGDEFFVDVFGEPCGSDGGGAGDGVGEGGLEGMHVGTLRRAPVLGCVPPCRHVIPRPCGGHKDGDRIRCVQHDFVMGGMRYGVACYCGAYGLEDSGRGRKVPETLRKNEMTCSCLTPRKAVMAPLGSTSALQRLLNMSRYFSRKKSYALSCVDPTLSFDLDTAWAVWCTGLVSPR